jgi:hypothetical protein
VSTIQYYGARHNIDQYNGADVSLRHLLIRGLGRFRSVIIVIIVINFDSAHTVTKIVDDAWN